MDTPLNPTLTVANRLVELCSQGQFHEAMIELYADDACQIEATSWNGDDPVTRGKEACLAMSQQLAEANEIHGGGMGEATANGDQFIVSCWIDMTPKEGPMAGQRMKMEEQALYTVKDGKIVEAKFFYNS